jgi:hypothetical protein
VLEKNSPRPKFFRTDVAKRFKRTRNLQVLKFREAAAAKCGERQANQRLCPHGRLAGGGDTAATTSTNAFARAFRSFYRNRTCPGVSPFDALDGQFFLEFARYYTDITSFQSRPALQIEIEFNGINSPCLFSHVS